MLFLFLNFSWFYLYQIIDYYPEKYQSENLIVFEFSVQSLYYLYISYSNNSFEMFPGTLKNVPMFLNFLQKCSVRTEQNKFWQNIEKMFCRNRTFPRTLVVCIWPPTKNVSNGFEQAPLSELYGLFPSLLPSSSSSNCL